MARILNLNKPDSFRIRWQEANDYISAGRLEEALKIFEGLSADGYSEACVEIGNILERGGNGFGDEYGYIGLARLALQGYSDAGTPSDAVDYLRKAINAKNPVAMTILGTLHHSGRVVEKDLQQAARLYEKAHEQGYVLPLVYLSKVKMEQRRYLAGLRLRAKAIWEAYCLARKDPSDPRLWNYF
jgi:TPR repeat protein